ncbi:MAG: hypothetical protein SNJ64_01835, partial [Endomicrobiia bacterium]
SDICVTLRAKENFGFLFVFNYHMVEKDTTLSLKLKEKFIKIPKLRLGVRSCQILPVNIKLNDSVTIDYSNVEIVDFKNSKKGLVLITNSTSKYTAEIVSNVTKKIKKVKIDGKIVKFNLRGNNLKINFETNDDFQEIEFVE